MPTGTSKGVQLVARPQRELKDLLLADALSTRPFMQEVQDHIAKMQAAETEKSGSRTESQGIHKSSAYSSGAEFCTGRRSNSHTRATISANKPSACMLFTLGNGGVQQSAFEQCSPVWTSKQAPDSSATS